MVSSFDVIIGDAWMVANKVIADFGNQTLSFPHSKPCPPPELSSMGREYLTYLGTKRLVDQGCATYLCIVRCKEPECSEPVSSAPSAVAPDPIEEKLATVDSRVRGRLTELIQEYRDVFPAEHPIGDPPARVVPHIIPLEDNARPMFKHSYRMSPLEMEEAEKQVTGLLAKGWIQPSQSPRFLSRKRMVSSACVWITVHSIS
jgi:hypothetical protein